MAGEISAWKRRVIVELEPGGGQTVRALCPRLGVSGRSFYRLRAAFRSRGPQALVPAPRAPLAHAVLAEPNKTSSYPPVLHQVRPHQDQHTAACPLRKLPTSDKITYTNSSAP